jgi:NAD(P)H dehydrogenase (quinone)
MKEEKLLRMNISLILAHPNGESFNHAIARTAETALVDLGHHVWFHDLYAEKFDPLLPHEEIPKDVELPPEVASHCNEIASVDGIIIVHPNWWGQPPAILKGWVDRVIRPGVAYCFLDGDSGEGVPVGLLKAKSALVLNTSNTPMHRERAAFGDPLETLWKNCIFGLCGVNVFRREMFGVVVTSSPEERAQWLADVRRIVAGQFPRDEAS